MFVTNFRALSAVLFTLAVLNFIPTLLAQSFDPELIRGRSKSDISKKRVEVLQDRYFKKAFRPELGLLVGSLLDEPYVDTRTLGGRLGFFFNEFWGIEAQYTKGDSQNSEELKFLNSKFVIIETSCLEGPTPAEACKRESPQINRIDSTLDINVVYAPFYGKVSLKDLAIIYTDTYFTAGYSQLDTEQGKISAVMAGVGQRFNIFKSLSLRVDARDRIFTEERGGKDFTRHSWQIDFGVSYFFLGD